MDKHDRINASDIHFHKAWRLRNAMTLAQLSELASISLFSAFDALMAVNRILTTDDETVRLNAQIAFDKSYEDCSGFLAQWTGIAGTKDWLEASGIFQLLFLNFISGAEDRVTFGGIDHACVHEATLYLLMELEFRWQEQKRRPFPPQVEALRELAADIAKNHYPSLSMYRSRLRAESGFALRALRTEVAGKAGATRRILSDGVRLGIMGAQADEMRTVYAATGRVPAKDLKDLTIEGMLGLTRLARSDRVLRAPGGAEAQDWVLERTIAEIADVREVLNALHLNESSFEDARFFQKFGIDRGNLDSVSKKGRMRVAKDWKLDNGKRHRTWHVAGIIAEFPQNFESSHSSVTRPIHAKAV
jgi:hypothetical protein